MTHCPLNYISTCNFIIDLNIKGTSREWWHIYFLYHSSYFQKTCFLFPRSLLSHSALLPKNTVSHDWMVTTMVNKATFLFQSFFFHRIFHTSNWNSWNKCLKAHCGKYPRCPASWIKQSYFFVRPCRTSLTILLSIASDKTSLTFLLSFLEHSYRQVKFNLFFFIFFCKFI